VAFWVWNVALAMKDSNAPSPHEHRFPLRIRHLPSGFEIVEGRGPCECGMSYSEWLAHRWFTAPMRFLGR
jgi:hypothetical protein